MKKQIFYITEDVKKSQEFYIEVEVKKSMKEDLYGIIKSMVKSAEGEGSRGGVVIGHTRSGKPIYQNSSKHPSFKEFSKEDHEDAKAKHKELSEKFKKDKEEGRVPDYREHNHHHREADEHGDEALGPINTTPRGAKAMITKLEKQIDGLSGILHGNTSHIAGYTFPENTFAEFKERATKEVQEARSKVRRLRKQFGIKGE